MTPLNPPQHLSAHSLMLVCVCAWLLRVSGSVGRLWQWVRSSRPEQRESTALRPQGFHGLPWNLKNLHPPKSKKMPKGRHWAVLSPCRSQLFKSFYSSCLQIVLECSLVLIEKFEWSNGSHLPLVSWSRLSFECSSMSWQCVHWVFMYEVTALVDKCGLDLEVLLMQPSWLSLAKPLVSVTSQNQARIWVLVFFL